MVLLYIPKCTRGEKGPTMCRVWQNEESVTALQLVWRHCAKDTKPNKQKIHKTKKKPPTNHLITHVILLLTSEQTQPPFAFTKEAIIYLGR